MSASGPSAFVSAGGRSLEFRRIAAAADGPTLVFLHEGLGSISQWRDFPDRIVEATGLPAVIYARYGYGQSEVLQQPHGVDFMHREALESLPELLRALGIARPILIGHSDGASIALIYAGSGHPLRGLVVMAPHVFVEDITIDSVVAAKRAFETTDLPRKLARHHRDPSKMFYGWSDVWLAPESRGWNIESFLPAIKCPLLAIQGHEDEYGSMAQVDAIARQAGGPVKVLKLEHCGHSPQQDQPEIVAAAIAEIVERCSGRGAAV
ncbi:MAG: alpha/beta hydrolase [Betaproteobacteria bacterium]|nr:MAG: alpha/beta hydrolase [Betaproteobacteria bacterium]